MRRPPKLSAPALVALLTLGAVAACAGGREVWMAHWFPALSPGPVDVWVCDRDGDAVVGLDARSFEVSRIAVPAPVRLAAAGVGRLWVACSTGSGPEAPHEVWLLASGGRTLLRRSADPVRDLGACGRDGVLVLESSSNSTRVTLLGERGLECELGDVEGATRLAGDARGGILIGTDQGELLVFDPAAHGRFPEPVARRSLSGATPAHASRDPRSVGVLDLEAGPREGTWWMLARGGGSSSPGNARVALLDAELAPIWSVPVDASARALIPVPAEERVWVVVAGGRGARRFGPGGRCELDWVGLPMLAGGGGVAGPGGAVAFVSPGALLAFDAAGRALPGQGGFEFLVDAVSVGRAPGEVPLD